MVGTGGRVGGSESESGVDCGGSGLLAAWRLGNSRSVVLVVVVVVICTGQKSSTEGTSRVANVIAFILASPRSGKRQAYEDVAEACES